MAYGDAFLKLIQNRKIGQFINKGDKPELLLTVEEVISIVKDGHVTDGTKGGLVIGKFHYEGGIHLIQPSGDKFKYAGEMEGYEYLINETATKKHMEKLSKMNQETKVNHNIRSKPFLIPDDIKIIDARRPDIEILLISRGGHFIVNGAASERNLRQLDSINSEE